MVEGADGSVATDLNNWTVRSASSSFTRMLVDIVVLHTRTAVYIYAYTWISIYVFLVSSSKKKDKSVEE